VFPLYILSVLMGGLLFFNEIGFLLLKKKIVSNISKEEAVGGLLVALEKIYENVLCQTRFI